MNKYNEKTTALLGGSKLLLLTPEDRDGFIFFKPSTYVIQPKFNIFKYRNK